MALDTPLLPLGKLLLPGSLLLGPNRFSHSVLIDSGADNNFIDPSLVATWQLPTVALACPVSLRLADGQPSSGGSIVTETLPLQLHLGPHVETLSFFVTPVAHGIILGHSWLYLHNPSIDWISFTVHFHADHCLTHCLASPTTLTGFPEPDPASVPPVSDLAVSSPTPLDPQPQPAVSPASDHSHQAPSSALRSPPAALDHSPSRHVHFIDELPGPDPDARHRYLSEFADLFTPELADQLPQHRDFDCAIDIVPDGRLPHGKIYHLTETELSTLQDYIRDNLARGFIQPSKSPAASPCFFIAKKDRSLRLCVDYRQLNKITVKHRYPLPLIPELIRKLRSARFFTALDLRNGYHLVRIRPGDEWKTAFVTPAGQFEYRVMPFGLANAPAVFQQLMNHVLREFLDQFAVVYLDDILIYSATAAEHDRHVRAVLNALRAQQLFCKAEKCHFFLTTISYLGHVISERGVDMDAAKVAAVRDWPVPTSSKELQSFLGFANYYRRFIPGFAHLAQPLTLLLRKHVPFSWLDPHTATFDALKTRFTTAPILQLPDPTQPFIVETDASDFAIGGVLSQRSPINLLHPVAFYSRQLTAAEQNYEIYDRELLAIFACFKQWRHFLQGAHHPVTVLCDHKNLVYFTDTKDLTRRQARWHLFFSEFDFTVTHKPGRLNGKADLLSRRQDFDQSALRLHLNRFRFFTPPPLADSPFAAGR